MASFGSFAIGQTPVPTVHVSGVQFESVIGGNFGQPAQLAVDVKGNVYVAGVVNNAVYKETLSNGTYTQSSIGSGLNSPYGVAVDSTGNVFISDSDNGRVLKETLATNGTYTQTVLPATGLGSIIYQIALDAQGDVYITDTLNNRVVKETVSGSTYVQSVVPSAGLFSPQGVAVDALGDVFIADTFNNRVLKVNSTGQTVVASSTSGGLNTPSAVTISGTTLYIADSFNNRILKETYNSTTKTYTQSVAPTSTLNTPMGVAVDAAGDVYVADSYSKRVIEERLSSSSTSVNFGAVEMGLVNPPQAVVTFTFDTSGGISAPTVLTQGAPGLDFTSSSASTCKTATYAAGATCTVAVIFSPKFSGIRNGAAVLRSGVGNPVATGWLTGYGSGSEVNFPPGIQSSIGSGFGKPFGVAVDGAGNLYIADFRNFVVYKETLAKGVYTQTTIGSGFSSPSAVAVDGAGNVYICDVAGTVYKETLSATGYVQSKILSSGLNEPAGVAVDATGNVFIADSLNDRVLKETPTASGYTQSVVDGNISNVWGVAVDGAGNVYAAGHSDDFVYKETPSASGYTRTTVSTSQLNLPAGLAVDGNGNLFIADDGNNRVLEEAFSASGITEIAIATGLNSPYGVSVDGGGDVFIAESGNAQVLEENLFSPPALSFGKVNTGTTSATQTVIVENVGNAPLTFPVPATGSNPSIAVNFFLNISATSACQVVHAGTSNPGTLAPGESCELAIGAAPAKAGILSGSLVLTDNNLNAAAPGYAAQTVALTATGERAAAPITWVAPAAISYGTPLSVTQFNAVAKFEGTTIAGTFVYTPARGTVLAAGAHVLSVTFTPTDTTDWAPNTYNVLITVNKAQLTVIADSASRTYGAANPALLYTLDGLVNHDIAASAIQGTPALSTTADAYYPWGNYDINISAGTLSAANYTFFLVPGTLFISKAPLTITANNATMVQGGSLPALTYTATGFVNGQNSASVLSGAPIEATTAKASSPAGSYPIAISQGTLWAENYTFTLVNGTLTITAAQATKPTFSHAAGTYTGTVTTALADTTPGATIYYTTNGAVPSASSTKYTGPIQVSKTVTIKAIAVAPKYLQSAVVMAAYTIK